MGNTGSVSSATVLISMIVCIKKKQPTKPSDLLPLLFPHDQMTLRSCQTAHIEPLARTRSGASASEPCRVVSGRDLDRFSYAPPPLGTTGTRSITFPRSWSLITGKKKEESKQHGHVVATLTSSSSSGLLPVYCSDRAQVLITEQSCVAFNPQHVACPVQSTSASVRTAGIKADVRVQKRSAPTGEGPGPEQSRQV